MTYKFPLPESKKSIASGEENILKFWQENRIFERTIESRSAENEFRFFDGPPFATGLPHYGHILAGTIKDAIPRYKTMQGFRVNRKWGWDCHGVPVEFQVEKEHKIGGKPGIEKMGVAKFNELCRSVVLRCTDDWEKTVHRMGRFVDFSDDYKTMDPDFMESVWWVFGQLWKKGLIYEGEKVVAYSPKLGSPLSNFEANLNYKDIDDPAVTVKFEVLDETGLKKGQDSTRPVSYFLAWTTTPWTLPSNLALAVHPDIKYVKFENPEKENEFFIMAEELFRKQYSNDAKKLTENETPSTRTAPYITEKFIGKDLVGTKYKPLFPWFKDHEGAFQVLSADYVSAEDGTGIVHQAPNFGEDDAKVCFEHGIKPFAPQPINEMGYFDDQIPELAGKYFRDDKEVEGSVEDNANKWVLENLGEKLFKREQMRHSYPHCWRTDCALMYRGINTWFVNIQKIKEVMIEKNQDINWLPEHLKDGRFGKMLECAPDWAISRNRYWGTPIPAWRCEGCGEVHVVSSREELENLSGNKVDDLHKHFVDDLTWKCEKCESQKTEITVMRHGETDWNEEDRWQGTQNRSLSEKGIQQAKEAKSSLGDQFDVVLTSDRNRAIETAKILVPNVPHIQDSRLCEKDYGDLEGLTMEETRKKYPQFKVKNDVRFGKAPGGESFEEFYPQVEEFLKESLQKYAGKRILIITHNITLKAAHKFFNEDALREKELPNLFSFKTTVKPQMKRIEEVLDCWFESGAMPYASTHYPFSLLKEGQSVADFDTKKNEFQSADFIAEGLDQTRGWFYTLHVLGCALFEKNIFENVITNGIILAEDGQKMSKSKKNYPDPHLVFDKYGADAMRYYLLSSPAVRGENFRFAENGVAEVLKSIMLPLRSAYQFFATYSNIDEWNPTEFTFVRHGEGDHNVAGIYSGNTENAHHLTEKGKAQVLGACKNIKNIDVLITSPFVRTRETVDILKKECRFNGEIIVDDRVGELTFGVLEGKEFLPRRARMAESTTEQPKEVQKRLREFLTEMRQKHRGKHIIVCSHGGVLTALDAIEARWTTHEEMLRLPVPQTGKIRSLFPEPETDNELDRWILSALQTLLQEYGKKMEAYDLEGALRPIPVFIDQLNNWYLRRNRQRFWASGLNEDKANGYETLHHVLQTISKILAPICPFFAEELYQNLRGGESVHLDLIPQAFSKLIDEPLNEKMAQVRDIVSLSASIRARAKIKLRQPLARLQVAVSNPKNLDLEVIAAEANVKSVEILSKESLAKIATKIVKVNARVVGKKFGKKVQELIQKGKAGEFTALKDGIIEIAGERLSLGEYETGYLTADGVEAEASATAVVLLDTEITSELATEGMAREIIRAIQELRKSSGFEISDRITVNWDTEDEIVQTALTQFENKISSEVLANSIGKKSLSEEEINIDDVKIRLLIQKA